MDTKELRIGNYVHALDDDENEALVRVSALSDGSIDLDGNGSKIMFDFIDIKDAQISDIMDVEPITLAGEWLLKFGFIKYPFTDAYYISTKFGDLMIRFLSNGLTETYFTNIIRKKKGVDGFRGKRYFGNLNSTKNITKVHELQNFCNIIGKELKTTGL